LDTPVNWRNGTRSTRQLTRHPAQCDGEWRAAGWRRRSKQARARSFATACARQVLDRALEYWCARRCAQLVSVYTHIAGKASAEVAFAFTTSIVDHCQTIITFRQRGARPRRPPGRPCARSVFTRRGHRFLCRERRHYRRRHFFMAGNVDPRPARRRRQGMLGPVRRPPSTVDATRSRPDVCDRRRSCKFSAGALGQERCGQQGPDDRRVWCRRHG
jgi:hypothetical protein